VQLTSHSPISHFTLQQSPNQSIKLSCHVKLAGTIPTGLTRGWKTTKEGKKKPADSGGGVAAAVELLPRADAGLPAIPAEGKVGARRAATKGGGIVYLGNVGKELAPAIVSVAVPVDAGVGTAVAVEKPNFNAAVGASVGGTYDDQLPVGG
jgi:hypothetical protein